MTMTTTAQAPRNLSELLTLAGISPAEPIDMTTETVGTIIQQPRSGASRTLSSAYLHIDDRDTLMIPARIRELRDRYLLPIEIRLVHASSRICERVDGKLVDTGRIRPNQYVVEWRGNLRLNR